MLKFDRTIKKPKEQQKKREEKENKGSQNQITLGKTNYFLEDIPFLDKVDTQSFCKFIQMIMLIILSFWIVFFAFSKPF